MLSIEVIIEGRADFSQKIWFDYCSTTLITNSNEKYILCDPGSNRDLLIQKLHERNIHVNNIDFVFITHSHLDHSLLAGIFPNAIIVTGSQWWKNGTEIHNHDGSYFGKDIQIIKTSGHSSSDSYLIIDALERKVCIAGDLFWWDINDTQGTTNIEIINHPDRFAIDPILLKKARTKILNTTSFIIPGHGNPFYTNR